ncbi:sensor histidine kinase [Rhizobium leguminosarum]|jgi:two-component sensor histidine kinase|uniref:histidine kinase n=1 Tax=Rhizobium leguminosarum TaxID=384 RepID=A0A7M3DNM7_RHILE|nr:sensor histidine kinase [Rhizobium leguminosarum]MBP2485592.1 two-component sensor histidine kinase [Rhizobium leguminosarum]MBY5463023.1 sensor histidine kinase [Rhizobium leguminosarum]MBY5916453.1 sensor histidine kinase [Rhizobium leguminosarum]NKJ98939.1 histidine kinase [Rhizobium leguminosarum bv. viciae]NKK41882.1 histidine kinase [Rhizobium leguminosarum bv. viciae]
MTDSKDPPISPEGVGNLPHLAEALDDDRFRHFLDHVPFAVAVSELGGDEPLIYVNLEFERLTALEATAVQGKPWAEIELESIAVSGEVPLTAAVTSAEEYIGAFSLAAEPESTVIVDVWSNTIVDDDDTPLFRLVAFAARNEATAAESFSELLTEKDVLLRELQHRVKNNLQMITALIRMEARNAQQNEESERFARLAGRIEALALLYRSLSDEEKGATVDLGTYVSQIAASVMAAHAVEGIRLDMKVDTWPVSVDVAMPAGLVINELLTNTLKHAFVGRDGGEITLRCVVSDTGCRITVADNGVGLPQDVTWPQPGKLSAMIVQSLKQNARAEVEVSSSPDTGMSVSLVFPRVEAAR